MTCTYILREVDFLQYELYTASKNDRVRNQIQRGRVINFIFFMSVGFFFFSGGSRILGGYFFAVGIFMILLFPYYSKWRYKNYYKRHVREKFSTRFEKPETATISSDSITISGHAFNFSAPFSDLDFVVETDTYMFINFTTMDPVIIPIKESCNSAELTQIITGYTSKQIPFLKELNWKW